MSDDAKVGNTPSPPRDLRRVQLERCHYPRISDWVFAGYDRFLNSRFGRYFPGRGKVRSISVKGIEGPLAVRLGTTDWIVVAELMLDRGYDRIFSKHLQKVRQIVDLGANIGISVRLWQINFPSARIIAVEPDKNNLKLCRQNAIDGSSVDRTVLLRACAGAQSRMVRLDHSRGEWAVRMIEAGSTQTQEDLIPVLTMPEIFEKGQFSGEIDFLKCDIEGAERELFHDCRPWLPLVKNMLIELHDEYTPELFLADLVRNGGAYSTEILGSGAGYAVMLLQSNG